MVRASPRVAIVLMSGRTRTSARRRSEGEGLGPGVDDAATGLEQIGHESGISDRRADHGQLVQRTVVRFTSTS